MPTTRGVLAAIGLGLACLAGPAASAQDASDLPHRRPEEARADPLRAFDIDKDGTLDLAEVKSAAAARYDELNPDLDDRMDRREAAPVLPGAAFAQADTNHDGAIDKAEYLAYAERRFRAANHDRDGTLDRKELTTKAGRVLLRMLR